MISSALPKLLLAGLLALTLAVKVPKAREADISYDDLSTSQLRTFLQQHGFSDQATRLTDVGAALGKSGACRLLLINVAPQGWHRALTHRIASSEDRVRFVFRGHVYEDQPVWLTRIYGYWSKIAAALNSSRWEERVYGVVASPACDLERLPLNELAEVH